MCKRHEIAIPADSSANTVVFTMTKLERILTLVSVTIQDVEQDRWTDDVYKPDILTNWDRLYKKPGYGPL